MIETSVRKLEEKYTYSGSSCFLHPVKSPSDWDKSRLHISPVLLDCAEKRELATKTQLCLLRPPKSFLGLCLALNPFLPPGLKCCHLPVISCLALACSAITGCWPEREQTLPAQEMLKNIWKVPNRSLNKLSAHEEAGMFVSTTRFIRDRLRW